MYLSRYKKNLRIEGNNVISYVTHVATIDHGAGIVYRLGWWSSTTSKHINYVANELGYPVEDMPKDQEPKDQPEEESPLKSQFKSVNIVCAIGQLMCKDQKEKNSWDKRMLGTIQGIDFPEDFDNLSEKEKKRRLEGAKEYIK